MKKNKKDRREKRAARSKFRVAEQEAALETARELVKAAGMRMVVNRCHAGASVFLHVMLNDLDGRRLLNWWPTKGRYWIQNTGEKGVCPDIDTAVWLADQKRSGVVAEADAHLDAIARE